MPNRRHIKSSEEGYVLLIAMFLLAVLVLSLSAAAPQVAKSIQRDREVETFHRGMQYRRAIQLYYRKFHAYPPNIDALVKSNDIRFLRKKYIDPMTGKADWKPIMYGQNKTPTAMGFFGQPLAGNASSIAGVGPSGGIPGTPGSSPSGSGTPSSPGSDTDTGLTGQTFGGVGIIGFEPASPKPSILVYKKKNHYNEWEFTYDPLSDMKTMGGGNAGTIGQPVGTTPSPTGTTPSTPNGPGSSVNTPAMPPDTSAP